MGWLVTLLSAGAVALLVTVGCNKPPPASQPATGEAASRPAAETQPASQPARLPLVDGWDMWTREQASVLLADEDSAISAALRLIRLANLTSSSAPDPLTPEHVASLRLLRMDDQRRAIGRAADESTRAVVSPVILYSDGAVEQPIGGTDEATGVLYVADDPEVFPHLAVAADRVRILAGEARVALVLAPESGAHFALRTKNEFPYVGLMYSATDSADLVEAARFTWDPYELAFSGPLSDVLPGGEGKRFTLDMEASKALIPVGGVIEVPDPVENKPPQQPGQRPHEPEPQ